MRQPKTSRFFTKDHPKPHYIISNCLFFIFAFTFGMFSNPYLQSLPEFFQFFEPSFNFSVPTLLPEPVSLMHNMTLLPEPVSLMHNMTLLPEPVSLMHDMTLLPEPVSLMHNMSEEELLWRASFAPKVHHLPSSRVPKVAFLFLTRGDLPMAPFWDEFFKGHDGLYSIYVHPEPNQFMQQARWGSINMIEAERRLIANALLDSSNERFVLLSETCIPLYNFTTIYTYLVNSNMSYVGTFYDPNPGGLGRYNLLAFSEILPYPMEVPMHFRRALHANVYYCNFLDE